MDKGDQSNQKVSNWPTLSKNGNREGKTVVYSCHKMDSCTTESFFVFAEGHLGTRIHPKYPDRHLHSLKKLL